MYTCVLIVIKMILYYTLELGDSFEYINYRDSNHTIVRR